MATLYELTGAARDLYALLQADEIDEQTYNDTLEAIGAEDKVESYCRVIRQKEADIKTDIDSQIAVLSEEIDRLKKVKESEENKIADLKSRLAEYIEACGGKTQKGKTFTVWLAATSSVKINDADLIPKNYFRAKIELDKVQLKKALEAGTEISGAELEFKKGLRFR